MRLQNGYGLIVAHTSKPDEKCIFFVQTNVVVYVFDSQEYIHMEYELYNNRATTLISLVVEFF